jgi:hypothetical protein
VGLPLRYLVAVAVVVGIIGQSRAAFLPNEFAVYQLSKISSTDGVVARVSPLRAEKITTKLSLHNKAQRWDITDTLGWAEGPAWVPADDSLPHAFRAPAFGIIPIVSSLAPPVSYTCRPEPEYDVFVADIRLDELPESKTQLFSYLKYASITVEDSVMKAMDAGGVYISGNMLMVDRYLVSDVEGMENSSDDETIPVLSDTIELSLPVQTWLPLVVEFRTKDGQKEMSLFMGDSVIFSGRIGKLPDTTMTIGFGGCLVGSFSHFVGVTGRETVDNYTKWEADQDEGMCDTILYPTYVHQILYDPPGDGSSASMSDNEVLTSKISCTIGGDVSVTAVFGVEREFQFDPWGIGGKSGFSFELSATAKAAYVHGSEWSTTFSTGSMLSTSVDAFSSARIGPGGGDVVVYQPLKFERKMYRRPRLGGGLTGDSDSSFIYYILHTPVPDTMNYVRVVRMEELLRELEDDTAALTVLREESAIDQATGRIRPECIESGRVVKLDDNWDFSGNAPVKNSQTEKTGFTETHKLTVGLSVDMKMKMQVSGISTGTNLHVGFSAGGGTSGSVEDSRTVAYTLSDDESWDNFAVAVYLDKRFGTYIFQVDSAKSYSSFPIEQKYSRAAADFTMDVADRQLSDLAGNDLEYVVTVCNTSSKLSEEVTFTAEVMNFPHDAAIFPNEADVAPGDSAEFTVTLNSGKSGAFPAQIRVTMTGPGSKKTLTKEETVQAIFTDAAAGLSAECGDPYALVSGEDPDAQHTFTIDLINLSDKKTTIETGISVASQGVTYQIGSFSNPVPSGADRKVSIAVTGEGDYYPYTLTFWSQLEGNEDSYKEITLTIGTDSSAAVHTVRRKPFVRPLDVCYRPGAGLFFSAPGNAPAIVELFAPTGRLLFRREFTGAGSYGRGGVGSGLYIGRVRQAGKLMQRCIRITR